MIKDLLQAVHALQPQERMGTCMEILEGEHNLFDMLKGGPKANSVMEKMKTPLMMLEPQISVAWGRLEEQLASALDLSGGGIKIEVSDFYERMHAEDYLDWEASLENYFWVETHGQRQDGSFFEAKI